MEQFLDITNCLGVQALAETHGLHHLADTARKLAVGDFTRLYIAIYINSLPDLPLLCAYRMGPLFLLPSN
ncbi:unnamed protein product [Protopolystoma xenopodis]|uniref:Uncharacterized protein n=1 Tax=Protopolystoma xenopodis TaxID=117903 RepID=A0A448X1G8_9PLAT|nr:unnamed protein product [Protopolystoma xenopodis]